jgi:hypothetical protein
MVVEIDNQTYNIPKQDLNLAVTSNLSIFYKQRLTQLTKDKKITESQALEYLLDYYYLDNTYHLHTFSMQLSKRLFQGVDRSFIIYLRSIYTTIGHFLKKLRYI